MGATAAVVGSDHGSAGIVTARPGRREHHRHGTIFGSAQSSQQTLDHSSIYGTEHGVLGGGITEGAVVGHHGRGGALVLSVSGEAVCCEGVGNGMHGRPQRALALSRGHLASQGPAVVLADSLGHGFGSLWAQEVECFLEEEDEQVISAGEEVERGVVADDPEPLGRAAGSGARPCGTFHGHFHVATSGQALEVVACHVGVDREPSGHLGSRCSRVRSDEEVDLPPSRVAEG